MNILKSLDFVAAYGFRLDKRTDIPHVAAIRGSTPALQNCTVNQATAPRLGFMRPEHRNLLSRLTCVFSSRRTQGKRAAGRYEAYLQDGTKRKGVAFLKLLQRLAYAKTGGDAQEIMRAMTPAARADFLLRMQEIVDSAREQQTSGKAFVDGSTDSERKHVLSAIGTVATLWQSALGMPQTEEYAQVLRIQRGIYGVEMGRAEAAAVRANKVFAALTTATDYGKVLTAVHSATRLDAQALLNHALAHRSDEPLEHPLGPVILALYTFKRYLFTEEMVKKLQPFEPFFKHRDCSKLFRYGHTALDVHPREPKSPWHYYKEDGLWYEQLSREQNRRLFAPA